MFRRLFFLFALVGGLFFLLAETGKAQDEPSSDPVYVVQPGDTLWDIARRFGLSLDDLVQANPQVDAALLKPGYELKIPGLTGVTGRLETRPVALGETLVSLSRDAHVSQEVLVRLNRILSPRELYIGREMILPVDSEEAKTGSTVWKRLVMERGQSALELAVLHEVNPWHLSLGSGYSGSVVLLPGDVLRIGGQPASADELKLGALLPQITGASVDSLPLVQGRTAVIRVNAPADLPIQGLLVTAPLNFFYTDSGEWVALQGVHAMLEPGLYPLILQAKLPGGSSWSLTQRIRVIEGNYPFDPELLVDPATIDPEITQPENEQWNALTAPVTAQKLWDGLFTSPVDPVFTECWPSTFGNRRSYNQSGYNYFHTGLDFCGTVGNAVYAPAAGEVVFQGFLAVRGNATVINHGQGVYTAYMHQSEILVKVGDRVSAGQLIGRVGNTGRVTGPHLHLEIWVGGVQVDPLEWLQRIYP